MKPILQIIIPTFNRPEKLEAMLLKMVQIEDLVSAGRLKILVLDNSDADYGPQLGLDFHGFVEYSWNGGNLGYQGNIRKCLSKRNAIFSWLIADDDELSVSKICKIVDYLENHQEDISGLALPYEVQSMSDSDIQNDISLKPHFGTVAKFGEIILPHRIPFDFLSSFIVKSDLLNRVDLSDFTSHNDYFHSLIYCSCLRSDDEIAIYDAALISYNQPKVLNWSLYSIVLSKYEICDVVSCNISIQMNKSAILSEVLKWATFGRIGTISIRDLDKDIQSLVRLALYDRSVKNLLLALLLIVPASITREVAIFALAISARKYTSESFLKRLRTMRKNINANTN